MTRRALDSSSNRSMFGPSRKKHHFPPSAPGSAARTGTYIRSHALQLQHL
jgi:hypothetical protein